MIDRLSALQHTEISQLTASNRELKDKVTSTLEEQKVLESERNLLKSDVENASEIAQIVEGYEKVRDQFRDRSKKDIGVGKSVGGGDVKRRGEIHCLCGWGRGQHSDEAMNLR